MGSSKTKAFAANNLGVAYKDYENAERWFNEAISYDLRSHEAYYHLGVIYLIKGNSKNSFLDLQKAEEYLKKTLEIKASYGRAHLILAEVYMGLGDKEKAREHAKKAYEKGLIEPFDEKAKAILEMDKD